jgi:preprotein translocase subunit SecA
MEFRRGVFDNVVNNFVPPDSIDEQWDLSGLEQALDGEFGVHVPLTRWAEAGELTNEQVIRERVEEAVNNHFDAKEAETGPEVMRHFEKALTLNVLDQQWKDHLARMDYLRQGIHLRGYAQKQPMQEYKREAFEMFSTLMDSVEHDVVKLLARVQVRAEEDVEAVEGQRQTDAPVQYRHDPATPMPAEPPPQPVPAGAQPSAAPNPGALPGAAGQPGQPQQPDPAQGQPFVRDEKKVGRNEPCPCGSGRKFKQCHGKLS